MHVDIHADTGFAIADCDHQIGRFPANPRESDQLFDGVGNRTSVDVQKAAADGMNGLGFCPVESNRIDGSFDLFEGEG